ncbi:MAG: leucine-rich repeat domain-containing protein [Prevotellaceae bacterium]|nr:leucine-rich repeat domain-containing protein [Candidatus Colivivens equi]
MFKKLFSLFAALTLSAGLWAATYGYFYEGNLLYHIQGGVVYICNGSSAEGFFTIPTIATDADDGKSYNVVGLDDDAFLNNSGLETIVIPSSISSISSSAFFGCSHLKDVYVSWTTSVPGTANTLFKDVDSDCTLHMPYGTESLYSGDGWKSIAHAAYRPIGDVIEQGDYEYVVTGTEFAPTVKVAKFNNDGTVFDLNIPALVLDNGTDYAVTKIADGLTEEEGVFYFKNIFFATIPDNVLSIGDYAFYFSNIYTVDIPNSVKTIGRRAFGVTTMLQEVTIPTSVKTIKDEAFNGCNAEDVYVKWTDAASIPTISTSVFGGKESDITLHVPDNTKSIYQSKNVWKNFNIVDLAEVKAAAAQQINEKVSELTGDNPILNIATQAIAEIYAATSEKEVQEILNKYLGLLTNAIDAYDEAKGSGADLPTEGDCGPTVIITKDDKTLILYNVDDVEYTITECDPV